MVSLDVAAESPMTTKTERAMRLSKPLLAAGVAVLLLAGCDKLKGGGGDVGPVAATVNGEKITVSQIATELKASGAADPANPEVQKLALQRIIARKLLAGYAKDQKLDATPEAKVMQAASQETFAATLAQRDAVAKAPAPTDAEVDAFIAANPAMFAQRTLYLVEAVTLDRMPDAATEAALKPVDAFPDVLKVLDEHQMTYKRGQTQLDTLQIDPKLAANLLALKPDQAFVLPAGRTVAVAHIRQSKVQPFQGSQAVQVARQILTNQRQTKAADDRLKGLLKAAEPKITYGAGFAPPPKSGT